MSAHHSTNRQASGASDLGSRLRCDVTWGRFLFQPPELTNPHIIFDPLPFRAHEHIPVRSKKSSGSR